jgi:hypothetical protein
MLLDYFKTAVNEWIIYISPEVTGQGFRRVNIFKGLPTSCPPPPFSYACSQNASDLDILLRNELANPSLVESLSETGVAETLCLLRKAHFNRLCCRNCNESLLKTPFFNTPLATSPRSLGY